MRLALILFLLDLSFVRPARSQQPLVPVEPPTPSADYKYRYRVVAQDDGPTSAGPDGRTIQAINQYALSESGSVAYIAQMSAPAPDRGRLGLFIDGALKAETGAQFNRRLLISFIDILGFSRTGTLFFLAVSADPSHPGEEQKTFFSTGGMAYVPTNTIGGCALPQNVRPLVASSVTIWAFSPVKGDFMFDADSRPAAAPAPPDGQAGDCDYGFFTPAEKVVTVRETPDGVNIRSLDAPAYQDKPYYLATAVGNNNARYVFAGRHQLQTVPAGARRDSFWVSPKGNVFFVTPEGIIRDSKPAVSNGVKIGNYQLSSVDKPIETAVGLFFRGRFEYRRPAPQTRPNAGPQPTDRVHSGLGLFTNDGPVFPVVPEAKAPWTLGPRLQPLPPFYANDSGQVLTLMTIGLRNVLMLATPATIKESVPDTVNFFIGGLLDQTLEHVVERYVAAHMIPGARYYPHDQGPRIEADIRQLPPNTLINLIGHSYGGDTAVDVAIHCGRMINILVTVDPVGGLRVQRYPTRSELRIGRRGSPADPSWHDRLIARFDALKPHVSTWIDVDAAPVTDDRSDGIAAWGGKWDRLPDQPVKYDTIFIRAQGKHHFDFDGMIAFPDKSGKSAQSMLMGY